MKKQAKARLPKVWIELWASGNIHAVYAHKTIPFKGNTIHQYAPVQPPRRCVWTENEEGQWDTQCGGMFEFTDGGPADNEQKFCGYCGGKLKAKHYDNSGGTWEECVHGRKS